MTPSPPNPDDSVVPTCPACGLTADISLIHRCNFCDETWPATPTTPTPEAPGYDDPDYPGSLDDFRAANRAALRAANHTPNHVTVRTDDLAEVLDAVDWNRIDSKPYDAIVRLRAALPQEQA